MKQKCKQIFSVLLTLCMALSLLTVTAAAAEGDEPTELYVNGVDMLAGGTVEGVTYDGGVLTLENADLSIFHSDATAKAAGVIFVRGGSLTVRVKGENNKITYADTGSDIIWKACGIYFDSAVTIDGGGTLTVQNAAEPGGLAYNYYDILEYTGNSDASLTVDSTTLLCEADNTKEALDKNICGIALYSGTLTVNSSTVSIHTRKSMSGNRFNEGLKLAGSNLTHKLTGNTVLTSATGSGNDGATGITIGRNASLVMDEGAKLYSTGNEEAIGSHGYIVPADGAKLRAVGSTDYAATGDGLTELALSDGKLVIEDNDTMELYKTVEVTAVSAKPDPDEPGDEPGEEPGEGPTVDPGSKPGEGEKPGDKPADKPADIPAAPKTGDAGVTLYIGIAAAAVLVCGGVIAVAHKRKDD